MGEQNKKTISLETATLAGGCFWCLEAVYEQLNGIESVISGYSGGSSMNPTYQEVTSGKTGHAEVVQITYNPEIISYKDLLEIFFSIHDPTTLNRQGNDVGVQYRSAIFYHNKEQKKTAHLVITEIEAKKLLPAPVVTEVTQYKAFFPAEEYHQGYYRRNPYQPYCQVVIAPKVAKFKKRFLDRLTV